MSIHVHMVTYRVYQAISSRVVEASQERLCHGQLDTCMRFSDRLMRALGTLTSSTAQRTGVPCWTTDSGVMTTSHDSSEMCIMPCRSGKRYVIHQYECPPRCTA